MNKLILIITVLMLTACTGVKHIPATKTFTGLDLRPYTEKGFLITPFAYTGEYEAIGIMQLEVTPEATNSAYALDANEDTYHSTGYGWTIENMEAEDAINEMYEECKKRGADALVDFKLEYFTDEYAAIHGVAINGFRVSGFAIKRK